MQNGPDQRGVHFGALCATSVTSASWCPLSSQNEDRENLKNKKGKGNSVALHFHCFYYTTTIPGLYLTKR